VDPIDRARELFWMYDGSGFYMSRDSTDVEYRRYSVPKQLEKQWLEELTTTRLDMLEKPGNWDVVHFLWHHSDTRYLPRLIQTKPLGAVRQRCSYLENLLGYVTMCARAHAVSQTQIREAAEYVLDQAKILDTDTGEEGSRCRVQLILERAAELHSSTRG
jgi:hypothetical protein